MARNGPEFEAITKAKQQGNPKFGFLYGGDYYQYYQWRVSSEQTSKQSHQRAPVSINATRLEFVSNLFRCSRCFRIFTTRNVRATLKTPHKTIDPNQHTQLQYRVYLQF